MMRLPKFVINWLLKVHGDARTTPYFHLEGYMLRDWILGYRSPERNTENPMWKESPPEQGNWFYRFICHHIAIRAHSILRSDQDRHLHDHPAWSVSIVLSGGYWEVCEPGRYSLANPLHYQARLSGVAMGAPQNKIDIGVAALHNIHWRDPGAVVFRKATAAHRLILPPNTITKSIFAMGRKTNRWGFYTDTGKIGWREYLGVEK